VDVWSPAGFGGTPAPSRSRRRLEGCLARLQPGVTVQQAQSRLADYGAAVSARYPVDYPARNGWHPRLNALQDDVVGGVATPMFVLLSGVALLLLVACVNVAHLVLARASARRQEMAIRRALGASPGRLAAQAASESAVLAAAAGALALLVASWSLRGLVSLVPGRVPRADAIALDASAALVTLAITVAVTAVFAFGPALPLRPGRTFADLKDGGAGRGSDGRGARARGWLVAAEVAMATVLLVGAGLLVRTVASMLSVPLGFETERLAVARIALPRPNDTSRATYLDPARRVAFYREVLRRVDAIPGVARAAMSSQIPLGGFNPPLFVEIEGRDPADPGVRPVAHDFQVSPRYFDALGTSIVRGRAFLDTDRAGAEPVAIVSETAARMFWTDDPVGKRVRYGSGTGWMTVIGVAGDVLTRRLTEPPQPILYRPLDQASDLSMGLIVRTRVETPGLAAALAREVRAVDPDLPIYGVRTMDELIESAVAQRRFLMRLLVAFGTLATGLALLGIYGVMAYSVAQRTREIGIRIAIGARQQDVARMILGRGLALTGAGIVAGLAAALGLTHLVESQLFGVRAADPVTLTAVLTLMTAVAAVAAYVPARRAAGVDPVAALRSP
jgi:putative ABC transport system permease protein